MADGGGGFILLFRKIRNHDFGRPEPACKRWALTDLIMEAAYAPHSVTIKNETIVLDRGDFVASVRFLARRWGWSLKKTGTFLNGQVSDGTLAIKRHGTGNGSPSVLRLVNYNTYQGDGAANGNGSGNAQETVGRRLGDETKEGNQKKKKTTTLSAGNGVAAHNGHRLRRTTGSSEVQTPAQTPEAGASVSMADYLESLDPSGQELLRQTITAIARTRKTGQVAPTILDGLARKLSQTPTPIVLSACQIYLDRDYAGEGKNEHYLLGIVRGESKQQLGRGEPTRFGVPGSANSNGHATSALPQTEGQRLIMQAAKDLAAEQAQPAVTAKDLEW
jgi:hypothetical protein